MKSSRRGWVVLVWAGAIAGAASGVKALDDSKAAAAVPPLPPGPVSPTQPAAPAPAAPTQPQAPAQAQTHVVKEGTLTLKFESPGTFLPVEPFEVRPRPKAFKGELTITSIAPNGAAVKAGDILLEIDPADLKRELEAAENERAGAAANLAKAQSDVALGEKADALALQVATEGVATAEANLKWWDELTGPQMLKSLKISVMQAKASVEDQNDELEELRKMYKAEELTSTTADIVIKRALRSFEVTKIAAKMQEDNAAKAKQADHPLARRAVEVAAEQARQQLAALQAAQAQAKVLRGTALKAAQIAAAGVDLKAAELKGDLEQLSVKAPADGVVLYGQSADAGWAAPDPRALRPGENVAPGAVVMTLFTPGRLKVAFDVPEGKIGWVTPGVQAAVTPAAFPELSYTAPCGTPPPTGKPGAEPAYTLSVDVPQADPRLRPGMKATVRVNAGQTPPALLVLAAAVVDGKVKVRGKDGAGQDKPVVVGRTDGQMVEVRQGLTAGEEVVLPVK